MTPTVLSMALRGTLREGPEMGQPSSQWGTVALGKESFAGCLASESSYNVKR